MSAYANPQTYGTTRADAVRAFNDGVPSVLPSSNRWKTLVEAHRWGRHAETDPRCPVCP